MKPFETFDHTADVGLVAYGRTLQELFKNAALGVMSLVVETSTTHPGGFRDRINADALDKETLLINWLNQVLFLYNVQQVIFCRFEIQSFSDTKIVGEGEGELFDPGRHNVLREIKAATFSDLKIEKKNDLYTAKIVLDV